MQLPETFINSIQNAKGFSKEAFEKVHASGEQITSIRINPNKQVPDKEQPATTNLPIPWCQNGFYLDERPSFTLDPIFHAGAYYVQEASSMFLEQALQHTIDLSQPIKVLDLCAAPGGKSTLIQSLISADSLLVSNEVIKTRVNILAENITKWGAANVVVTNNDPKDFQRLENYFDVIVIDAPCSGSGLFRKDPAAIEEWSENNVQLCSQRQQRIIADIFPSLKETGIVIYSTCSYSEEEDEAIADWIVEEFKVESLRLKVDDSWGIIETESRAHKAFGYRFYPDKVKGEGFFIAAFSKQQLITADEQSSSNKKYFTKKKTDQVTDKEIDILKPFLKDVNDFFFIRQNEEVIAMPKHLDNDLVALQSACYIKKAGVKMGTIIRNELIPDHELALSTIMNASIPCVETDKETALQYLRRQDIKIDTPLKGWALLTHRQVPLGWIKILPNRINNYYPKDWRIFNK